jgi:hypothetical protein
LFYALDFMNRIEARNEVQWRLPLAISVFSEMNTALYNTYWLLFFATFTGHSNLFHTMDPMVINLVSLHVCCKTGLSHLISHFFHGIQMFLQTCGKTSILCNRALHCCVPSFRYFDILTTL